MSNAPDLDLNLENLFQPAWAQGKAESNRFEKFTGNEGVKPERATIGGIGRPKLDVLTEGRIPPTRPSYALDWKADLTST